MKAKYHDLTKTDACSIVPDPMPNIYQMAHKNSVETPSRAMETGRFNWWGLSESRICETCHDVNKPREFEPCASCGEYKNWREK